MKSSSALTSINGYGKLERSGPAKRYTGAGLFLCG